jgi:hypothetical protein
LEQIAKYHDTKAPDCPAYLVIFNRRDSVKSLSWDERIYWQEESEPSGKIINVLGL